MILTDAGPLVALIDADEPDHSLCVRTLGEVELPLLTTWPAFTEACYLLGRSRGWRDQEPLWRLVLRGDLVVADLQPSEVTRTAELMEQYASVPMDLADASLVALAESGDHRRIFTLDTDFSIYRLRRRGRARALELLPR